MVFPISMEFTRAFITMTLMSALLVLLYTNHTFDTKVSAKSLYTQSFAISIYAWMTIHVGLWFAAKINRALLRRGQILKIHMKIIKTVVKT